MISSRQALTTTCSSLKTKPIKQINNINSTNKLLLISTQSNLLGQVDLDDKYEFPSIPNKFNFNIQTMIDSKWNALTLFHHHADIQIDDDDSYFLLIVNVQYVLLVLFNQKKYENDCESFEQHAEEHSSRIDTASYVDKVGFNARTFCETRSKMSIEVQW
ncbi:unnamed protein product [Rotaria sp. Silwood2]|nr:unnamed protein product [Rotaria sp. Silwood2]CAF2719824.1 unnamed protein product [Rotaria sp. Silwood2]CAF3053386.1 unnamed protein product [Rotaria sp. Silwood2]CAF3242260.1 unnamed protein product [Rotaria sp. Silwood2]CAF3910755.1 unnamed protein product [Rotaria sp. Silwood2]